MYTGIIKKDKTKENRLKVEDTTIYYNKLPNTGYPFKFYTLDGDKVVERETASVHKKRKDKKNGTIHLFTNNSEYVITGHRRLKAQDAERSLFPKDKSKA